MQRNYIGLACSWHDPALAIVDSRGEVVFAEATERYLQKKRALNCPPDDLSRIQKLVDAYCEPGADLIVSRTWTRRSLRDNRRGLRGVGLVDRLLRMGSRTSKGEVARPGVEYMRYALNSHLASVGQASVAIRYATHWKAEVDFIARMREAAPADRSGSRDGRVLTCRSVRQVDFDHHLTHAAAACYSSPYREAVCAIVDGYGERGSTSFFRYEDGRIEPLEPRQRSATSIGGLYTLICSACGFDAIWGEEWKVMGLAPYGEVDETILARLEQALRLDDLRFVSSWDLRGHRRLLEDLAFFPRADVARTGQVFFERRVEELLGNLAKRGLSKNLVLGGGCALNSSANGKLLERTPFESLFVYCAPGDDGNAVGAAQLAFYKDHPEERPRPGPATPYLGSAISAESLANMLRLGRPPGHRSWPGRVHERAARLLAEGKIVGWVQGRAEFGPRALGNRSILADARRADVKDALNERVKFREEFRPFAPSILHEHGAEYFEGYQESPYMERTLRFRPEVRERVPGVVHVDGTGRLQTVKREWNERYYDLIAEFHRLTGVPLVLNTSFNVMGKPIIHTLEDALAVFYTSGLDALVVHDEVIEK